MGEIRCTVFFGWNFNHFHDILDGPKIILGLLLPSIQASLVSEIEIWLNSLFSFKEIR